MTKTNRIAPVVIAGAARILYAYPCKSVTNHYLDSAGAGAGRPAVPARQTPAPAQTLTGRPVRLLTGGATCYGR